MDAIRNLDFFIWLESTWLSTWAREGDFIWTGFSSFYVLLGFHSIGMAMVVGVCLVLSLRLFGYFNMLPLQAAFRLMPLAWWGFLVNLLSGIILFIGQPRRELLTITFDLKIIMIVLACITMLMMQRAIRNVEVVANADGTAVEVVPDAARTMALMANLFWLGAIISGRLIGYTQPPPP
jgi:hypothetical protein